MKMVFKAYDGTLFDSIEEGELYEHFSLKSVFVIVDDDPSILEILTTILSRAKITHKVFQDPLEAMNFISKNKVARVFTDYHMKGYGLSGKWIKEICDQHNVECTIISGDGNIADIQKIDFVQNCIAYMKD